MQTAIGVLVMLFAFSVFGFVIKDAIVSNSKDKTGAKRIIATRAHCRSATRTCHDCGGQMVGNAERYRYTECGLSSVTLSNVLVFRCEKCGLHVPEIRGLTVLHVYISLEILSKDSLLSGEEVRYLRKLARLTQRQLATIMWLVFVTWAMK